MKLQIDGNLVELTPQQLQQVFEHGVYRQRLVYAKFLMEESISKTPRLPPALFKPEDYASAMDEESFRYVLDVMVEAFASRQDVRIPDATTWLVAMEVALWYQAEVAPNAFEKNGKVYTAMSTSHLLRYVYRHIGRNCTLPFFVAHKGGGPSHNKFCFFTAAVGTANVVFCRCFRTGHCFAWQVESPDSKREYPAFAAAARTFLEEESSPSEIPCDTLLVAA